MNFNPRDSALYLSLEFYLIDDLCVPMTSVINQDNLFSSCVLYTTLSVNKHKLELFVLPRHRANFVYRRKYTLKVSKGA